MLGMELHLPELHARDGENLLDQGRDGRNRERKLLDDGHGLRRRPASENVDVDPHGLKRLADVVIGGRKELRAALALLLGLPARLLRARDLDPEALDETLILGGRDDRVDDHFVELPARIENEDRRDENDERNEGLAHAELHGARHDDGRERAEREGRERRQPAGVDGPACERHGHDGRDRDHLVRPLEGDHQRGPRYAPDDACRDGERRPAADPLANVGLAVRVTPEKTHVAKRQPDLNEAAAEPHGEKHLAHAALPVDGRERRHARELCREGNGKELEARENELGERARRDVVHRARHEEGAQKAPGLLADRKEVHGAASSDTRPSCDESLTRIPTGSESFL